MNSNATAILAEILAELRESRSQHAVAFESLEAFGRRIGHTARWVRYWTRHPENPLPSYGPPGTSPRILVSEGLEWFAVWKREPTARAPETPGKRRAKPVTQEKRRGPWARLQGA